MTGSDQPGRRGGPAAPELTLREVFPADDARVASALYRVGRAAYAVEAELIGFYEIPPLSETLADLRALPLRWLAATTARGQVAAFVAWRECGAEAVGGERPAGDGARSARDGDRPARDRTIDIDRVCVDPAWFRRGLATRLLVHLLEELAPGCDAEVGTGAANTPAMTLYKRLGFVLVDTFEPEPGLRFARLRLSR
ncbi:GNAT family N-acetyltransferase [Yinghuangia seranimata]|uniref:GNAT family N-acetyltransferase n=1 Tax=Yinghuangia seranimata TaxID=408067 RepID=UPI00248BDDCB|nr:GNAT family N-acetyltransferase [Yinghuangia seranimata]MDI2130837.1 GNAT family N-acetyltransferase [Yinghuangia seranimata]